MRESDEKVKQKLAEKKETIIKSVASDMNGERHLEGTLSFALAHTQACYKDSEPFTIFTYRGVLFDFSGLKWEQTRETALCGCQSPINLWNKQNIKNYTELYCHFHRKITVHTLSVYQYTFLLLCMNTAKDI